MTDTDGSEFFVPQKAQRHPKVASRSNAVEVITGLGTRCQVREWDPQCLPPG